MADSIKNIILNDLVAVVDAITKDGEDLFLTVKRGHPVRPQQTEVPAAFVVGLDERPLAGQFEEMAVNDLPVGIVVYGKSTDAGGLDAELVDLESRLRLRLEGYEPSGSGFPITHRTTVSPLSNANLPQGVIMVIFTVRYATLRADPFSLS